MEIKDRSKLLTEQRNPRTITIDSKTTLEIIDIINAEDAMVFSAIHKERQNIAKAVDLIVDAISKEGGRLIYVGAGTSGRLGILDAAECPPTFSTDPIWSLGSSQAVRRPYSSQSKEPRTPGKRRKRYSTKRGKPS